MPEHTSSTSRTIPPDEVKFQRARSLPSARPFRVAVLFSAIHYLALIASVTALVCFFLEPSQAAARLVVGGIVFSAITWLMALFKRRSTHCPLCKGTPLIHSGARFHVRALRVFPFNHGVSATLSILATQKFRCMYCGSDYDLLKTPSRLLHKAADSLKSRSSPRQDKRS